MYPNKDVYRNVPIASFAVVIKLKKKQNFYQQNITFFYKNSNGLFKNKTQNKQNIMEEYHQH